MNIPISIAKALWNVVDRYPISSFVFCVAVPILYLLAGFVDKLK